jgi:lysophospholipase L1-like esterase
MPRRLFFASLLLAAPLLAKDAPANTAVVPVSKLEKDCYDWWQRHEAVLAAKAKIAPEIVLVGDSITHFWGGEPATPGLKPRGPAAWESVFGGKKVLNLGFGWDRTQNVLWRLEHGEVDGLKPEWFVVNIGTNNSSGTANARANTPAETAEGVAAILARLKAKSPDSKIILMAVFPRGAKADDPKRSFIGGLNPLLAEIAKKEGATFIDLRDRFLAADGTLPKSLMPDGVHPNEAGYAIWAAALKEAMR